MFKVFELDGIVSGEDAHLIRVRPGEIPESQLVEGPHRVIHFHHLLQGPQSRRATVILMEFTSKEVGISRMQEPPLVSVHGDPCVPFRVTTQRNHEDFRRKAPELSHGIEAQPLFSFGVVGVPSFGVRELGGLVAVATYEIFRRRRRLEFSLHDVNLCLRKVVDATSMIKIQMGQNDVPHVRGLESEFLNLPEGRLFGIEPGFEKCPQKKARSFFRFVHVPHAQTRINENKTLIGFHKQAMTDEMGLPDSLRNPIHVVTTQGAESRAV